MGTYRKEWDCCDSVTETQSWEPESCPFCSAPPSAENRPAIEVSAEPTAGYYYHQGWEAAKARFKDATLSGDDVRDAQRLNWLDARNEKFKMGWQVAVAPVGNVSVKSIVQLAGPIVSIREAIDAAIASQSASKENRPAQDDLRDAQRYRFIRGSNPEFDRDIDEQIAAAIASQSAKEPRS